MDHTQIFLMLSGLLTGAIDSIAGGGGLISLPVLSTVLDAGAPAIGTNKIVGTLGAFVAFLVYLRKHPLNLKKGLLFVLMVGLGSLLGSIFSPYFPKLYFRYLLIIACPLVLALIWNKKLFIQELSDHPRRALGSLVGVALGVGFYDGFFGPGGGTFMLLGLLWGVRLPLFEALILSKLANTLSAGVSLISYGAQGYVHPKEGITMAIGVVVGGFLGAQMASRKAEKVVRPVLALVVTVLLVLQLKEVIAEY